MQESVVIKAKLCRDHVDLLLCACLDAGFVCRVAFDGKRPMKLPKGGQIRFSSSLSPLPTINIGHLDFDWYQGITQKLKWNQTIRSQPGDTPVGLPLQEVLSAYSSVDAEECIIPPQGWEGGLGASRTASGTVTTAAGVGENGGTMEVLQIDKSLEDARPSTPDVGERGAAASRSGDLWCTAHYSEDGFYQ
jgi:hypothetical protein